MPTPVLAGLDSGAMMQVTRPAFTAGSVSAAARHFIDRYFPAHKIIPNRVDVDRHRRAVRLARRQELHHNLLFVGQFEAAQVPRPAQAYRILRKTGGADSVVGSGPQEREAHG